MMEDVRCHGSSWRTITSTAVVDRALTHSLTPPNQPPSHHHHSRSIREMSNVYNFQFLQQAEERGPARQVCIGMCR